MTLYAHSLDGRPPSDWEPLRDHAERVAAAAERRAGAFVVDAGPAARALGLLHDLGKAKPAFQRRLSDASVQASHSGEGARALREAGGMAGLLAGIVAGHHGRLPNPDRLARRIAAAEAVPVPDWAAVPTLAFPDRLRTRGAYRAQFLVRMLYSCLTDADDRETAAWHAEAEGRVPPARREVLAPDMTEAFDAHVARFAADTPVNALRAEVLSHVRARASEAPGLFTLTVPTGGGKTLASLGFALDHAAVHGLRRLIYVSPYTSITQQTAAVFGAVFAGIPGAVLEHHSDFDADAFGEDESERWRVASASWDAPVVVTTAVQLFESLHAARKKRCRKLHSLARSVIVIDEAQTLPRPFLRPCLAALTELVEGYGASVVLCTATQPSLTGEAGFPAPEALKGVRELAPDPPALHARLRRVAVRHAGALTDEAVAARMRDAPAALVIVNSRAHARALFERVRGKEGAMHLSTLMTPDHRRRVLGEVRDRLARSLPVRLVATSLVEAGVDLDFPLVMRAEAGLDQIAQAAGRCNREGRMEGMGEVLVFAAEHPPHPVLADAAERGRAVMEIHDDSLSAEAITAYFNALWSGHGVEALDRPPGGRMEGGILAGIDAAGPACPYEDIEAAFRMIEDGPSVVIRDGDWGVSGTVLAELRFRSAGAVAKALQRHAVSVPWKAFREMRDAGLIGPWEAERFGEQFMLLRSGGAYDAEAGLTLGEEAEIMNGVI